VLPGQDGSTDTTVMSALGSVTIRWRAIGFAGALFWFWYLAPAVVESRTLARMFAILRP